MEENIGWALGAGRASARSIPGCVASYSKTGWPSHESTKDLTERQIESEL